MAKNYGGCSHVRVLRSTDEAGDSQQVLWGCHDQEDGQLYSPRSWSLTHHLGDVALYTHTPASTLITLWPSKSRLLPNSVKVAGALGTPQP